MSNVQVSALSEWKKSGMVPIVGALGFATSAIMVYGLSPFVEPLQKAFGWSRADVTIGITISTVIGGICAAFVGRLVDKVGPRIIGIVGVISIASGFALMSTASGTTANWYMIWLIIAFAALPVQATVWTSAVASRFEVSRGMALAVTLAGAGLAGYVYPILGTKLIDAYGWRQAFKLEALICALVTVPLLLLFFHGSERPSTQDQKDSARGLLPGAEIIESLKSSVFIRLFLAGVFFTFTIVALAFHLFPILTDKGVARADAAQIVALVGIFSIIGRVGTGYLIDRFQAKIVGAIAFLLPIVACILLITMGQNTNAQLASAAIIGLTLGSEMDVIVYLATRHFGLKNFGAIYGSLLAGLSIGTAFGPLAAAKVYDSTGNYSAFLFFTIACMVVSSLALLSLPKSKFGHTKG